MAQAGLRMLRYFLVSVLSQVGLDLLLAGTGIAQTPSDLRLPPGTLEPPSPLPALPNLPEAVPPILETPALETPASPPMEGDSNLQVTIREIQILGSTVFTESQLQETVKDFRGKTATFEDLIAIRTAITDLYTRNGYTTSGAFLPTQDVTSGVIIIQVVEGGLERLEIQGLQRLRPEYIRSRLARATQTPLNLERLEAALQRLQLDPVLGTLQAELTAGSAPGLSVLKLDLQESDPITAAVFLENRDSPSVGDIRGTALLQHHNLLGWGDRLSVNSGITAGINNSAVSYNVPINSRDGSLSLRYSNTKTRVVESPFDGLGIRSQGQAVSVGLSQPLRRTPSSEITLGLSLDWQQSQTYILENIPFSFSDGPENGRSTVTALRFTQDWSDRTGNQVFSLRSQFSLGVGLLGATVRDDAPDGRFLSWLGQVQYVKALDNGNILIGRLGTQLANDALLPSEQFSIGGVSTVRGYRQNQGVADNGVIASLELRIPILTQPDGIGTVQLAPFFDVGQIWNTRGEAPNSQTLASLGLGLRWELNSQISANLEYGIPLISVDRRGNSLQDRGFTFYFRMQPF